MSASRTTIGDESEILNTPMPGEGKSGGDPAAGSGDDGEEGSDPIEPSDPGLPEGVPQVTGDIERELKDEVL